MEEKIRELVIYCKKSERIFLYGNGYIARKFRQVLYMYGIQISGYITSNKEENKNGDIPIYCVEEVKKILMERDLVIPAYANCSEQDVRQKILLLGTQFFLIDPVYIKFFLMQPYLQDINSRFKLKDKGEKNNILKNANNNILVVKIDSLGDTVCSTAFIRELRNNFQKAFISVVVDKKNEAVFYDYPYINEILGFESENIDITDSAFGSLDHIEKKIKRFLEENSLCKNYDMVFCEKPLMIGDSGIYYLLFSVLCGAKKRYVITEKHDLFQNLVCEELTDVFTYVHKIDKPLHESEYALELLRKLGGAIRNQNIELIISEKRKKKAYETMQRNGVRDTDYLIAVGVVGKKARRSWRIENYQKVFDFFIKHNENIKFVLFGGLDAVASAGMIRSDNVINLTGELSLDLSISCMSLCHIYVGSNTGLMHIAAALEKPCVTIYAVFRHVSGFNWNSPTRFGVRNVKHIDLLPQTPMTGCGGEECQMAYSHCINQVTVDEVLDAIDIIIDK